MILQEQFDKLGPWISKFEIDGATSGGWFDVLHEDRERVEGWLSTLDGVKTILECGSLEGGHTAMLARHEGVRKVIGLEAREANVNKARFIHKLMEIKKSTFVQADLEQEALSQFPHVDAVFCSGVLYHLQSPVKFFRQIQSRYVFLGTHYSRDGGAMSEGMQGHWYAEGGLADPLSGVSARSFWLTLDSLHSLIESCGYMVIDERTREAVNGPWVDLRLERVGENQSSLERQLP